MLWYNWLIEIVPFLFVIGMAIYTRRFIRDVVDFLSAGRVCGRYLISVASLEGTLGVITLVAYVEAHYKSGFAYGYWGALVVPFMLLLSLTGFLRLPFSRNTRNVYGAISGDEIQSPFSYICRLFANIF